MIIVLSILHRVRPRSLLLISVGLAASIAFWHFTVRTPSIPQRTLRIGFEQVPPVQIRTSNGFSGLAVETVKEAAKRAGVSLQWIETGTSSEEALRRRLVDLWPIMVDLPERRKYVHITKPWLYTTHTLVLLAEKEPPGREFAGGIALMKLPIHARLAREQFPNAQLVQVAQASEVLKEVCRGTVLAGFLDDRAGLAGLRDRPAECATMQLRVYPLPGLSFPLGVGSTFEAAGAADKIRDNIGGMFRDGTLAVTISKYSYFGIDAAWATYALMAAEERTRFIAWGLGGLGVALAVTVWQAASLRQKKKSEAALRESEERFRFAEKAASIGTFDWNIETGASTWTPQLEVIYGFPPGGFPGTQKAWESLVHPDDRPQVQHWTKESLQTGAPVESEWRVIWPDGSTHWVAGRWQASKDAAGKPQHVVGINIDITDRKNMEEALRKSEERFRLATKATNDAIWDIDLKAGTVSWNDTYAVLYGRPEGADSWQFWIDRIHPEDRVRTVDDFQAALGGGASSWSCEYRFRRVDGEWSHIYDRAYIARDASGKAWRVIGAMQDLTERRKSEAALRESEERFRRVFEEGPLGLGLVGTDYRFEKVNSALCRMVGYDGAELVRMSFVDITHPDDVQADVRLAEQLFKREIPFYRIQKRYMKKTGEIIWINLTASMIQGPDGEPLHGLAMVEDITEIKRTQEEALFRQKLESVGTLASGIAHDFNNLLGAVHSQAELGLEDLRSDSPGNEALEAIRGLAIRGSEIVRQLMIYAGTESAVVELVDLSKIVDDMLSLLKVSVTKHAVIKAHLDQDLPAIRASAAQIRQIVMNLITNASDAIGDRDGVIQVITRRWPLRGEPTLSSLQTSKDGDYVQLEVSDTGRGMLPQTQAKMFDPFFTTKSAGRGLGLAVVHGIVRSLGGSIHITSELGKGTTFQILLPCVETGPVVSNHMISGKGLPSQSLHGTVLVVEDEEYLRRAIVRMLRKNGFEVLEAADGSSAVDLIRAAQVGIDAILLDMTIPGASSREVVTEAANIRPDIRVILTSAYSQEMIEDPIGAPQIRSFLRKPYRFDDLVETLQSCLSA
jgi:PAS domain S-box-containing protein